jgi:vacuolar-type H+-ATPase subunit F/Vma7
VNRIAALGEGVEVDGLRLAGALVLAVDRSEDVEAEWDALPDDVAVLIVTPRVARLLRSRLDERPRLLMVVSPE